MNHADFWVVMFLAVGLKLPLIGLFYVIWKAAKLGDQAHAAQGSTRFLSLRKASAIEIALVAGA